MCLKMVAGGGYRLMQKRAISYNVFGKIND